MKKTTFIVALLFLSTFQLLSTPLADSTDVYLLTCAPGTEVYSVYGHTAIRVKVRGTDFDRVYNWGIFDFETPHFAFRFAKGKLDYLLGVYSYSDFLRSYEFEKRSVWSQKVFLTGEEKENLFKLLNENIKPENRKYRYNFFYDNCATRVRDILENAIVDTLIYKEQHKKSTFRQLIDPHQSVIPWLDFGADFLLGLQADRKASVRDEMFLPMFLKDNITDAVIARNGNNEPFVGKEETVFSFNETAEGNRWLGNPRFVLYSIWIFVILVTFVFGVPMLGKITDIVVYLVYSILALLLLFTNFFSDHQALHYNLLIIALNPLLPVLFWYIIRGRDAVKLSRIAITLALLWFPVSLVAGQGIHPAIVPLILILIVRLFKHCQFGKAF